MAPYLRHVFGRLYLLAREGNGMSRTARLVYLPGYPLYPEALMPRYRLAYAAGALSIAGHEARIHDFATVSAWEDAYPASERQHCIDLLARFGVEGFGQPLHVIKQLWQLRRVSKAFRASRKAWAEESLRALMQSGDTDAIIFEICDTDDVDLLGELLPTIRKIRPATAIAVLGPMADAYPQAIAHALPGLDAVFPHHPEGAIATWMDILEERGHWIGISNAWVNVGGRWVRGPRNPSPIGVSHAAYSPSVYPAIAGDEKVKIFNVEDYRGCHCQCNTCVSPHIGEAKSTDTAVAEVNDLFALHGATAFHFDGLGAPASHALAVAQAIQEAAKPAVRFSRDLHTANAVPALFSGLKRAGCVAVEFQLDTGSQRLLDNMYGRGLKVSYAEKVAAAAHEHGLGVHMRLTFPTPEDDYHTRAETLRILSRTRPQGAPVDLPEIAETSDWQRDEGAYGFRNSGLPGGATFPLPADRWRTPGGNLGPYSPSQAVQQVDTLRSDIESMGISTILSAKRTLMAEVAGAGLRPAAFAASFIEALGTGDMDWVRAMVARINGHACFAAEPGEATPMRTAMGDGA